MTHKELSLVLDKVSREYIPSLVKSQLLDIPRISFHISLILDTLQKTPSSLSICDIGGGVGLFSVGCAATGFQKVVLVDDFGDEVNLKEGDSALSLHKKYGVNIVPRDAVQRGIEDIGSGFDAITTFDSMEHWHHSPKRLFKQVMNALKPGGVFLLGVPNCVNLRKRIMVPLGYGKWSTMGYWYEEELFRSHVREPDVEDLYYIAKDMGLTDVRVFGRNWLGLINHRKIVRVITPFFDYPMRLFPSLCSDIYLLGRKRQD